MLVGLTLLAVFLLPVFLNKNVVMLFESRTERFDSQLNEKPRSH